MKKEINIKTAQGAKKNLANAKKNKNDEFYTRREDVENELKHYRHHFKNKVVFLNCDDPKWSEFYFYFNANFNFLGLKRLIATHYGKDAYVLIKTKSNDIKIPLKQGGDFRSEECINYLKEADIVVTNPPFSLFREFINLLMNYNKKFLIIGNINAISYKEIFPFLRYNKMWLGVNSIQYFKMFNKELSRPKNKWIVKNKVEQVMTGNGVWFTNLEHNKRNQELILTQKYYGNEEMYPYYDNYNAINVNKVKDIPKDYDGIMGVPISFMTKYNPNQFKIIGFRKGDDNRDLRLQNRGGGNIYKSINPENTNGLAAGSNGDPKPRVNGKDLYVRIWVQKI